MTQPRTNPELDSMVRVLELLVYPGGPISPRIRTAIGHQFIAKSVEQAGGSHLPAAVHPLKNTAHEIKSIKCTGSTTISGEQSCGAKGIDCGNSAS